MSNPVAVVQTAWRNILFLFASGMLVSLHFYKLSPALPFVRADLGLSLVKGGWLFSAISLVGMLFGILAGSMADALGHKRVILWSLVLLGLTSIVASFASNENLLMICRFLDGAGFMGITVAAPSLVAGQATENDRRMVMGIWSVFMPAGAVVVMLLAPPLLENFGWRVLWQVSGAMSLLIFMLMSLLVFPNMAEAPPENLPGRLADSIRQIICTPICWVLAIEFALYTTIFTSVLAWLPSYLVSQKGVDTYQAGLICTLVIIMNIVGGLSGGLLLRHGFDALKLIAISSLALAANIFGMTSPYIDDGVQLLFCLLFALAGGIWPSCIYAHAMTAVRSPELRGTINGFLINGANLGALVGPLALASIVTVSGGWSAVVWFIAPTAAIASLIACWVANSRKLATPVGGY